MNAYDQVPYPDLAYAQTHPDRLAVMGTLFGLSPASVATCRVLEIGCAAGGNLLPMAARLSQAAFVGIDGSARQIVEGHRRIARLGLENVRLLACDLRQAPADLGSFDYIIAHGLYSWVAEDVRDALLALCRELLAPHGIAYISYNTYPGWHSAAVVRDLMRFHTRDIVDPRARAQAARAIVKRMAAWIPADRGDQAAFFQRYSEELSSGLKGGEDGFLLHDELEAIHEPVYLYEFVEHAGRHGLRYLSEAVLRDELTYALPLEPLGGVQSLTEDRVGLAQYMDFVRNRMFRQTLLCHAERSVRQLPEAAAVKRLWVRSQARRAQHEQSSPVGDIVQFRSAGGLTLTCGHAVTHAALELLHAAWPEALPFDELLAAAQRSAHGSTDDDAARLAENLLRGHGYGSELVELHACPPRCAAAPGNLPAAWPVARLEAESRNLVTNLWHERIWLTKVQCHVLVLLDGTRARRALLEQLEAAGVAFTLHGLEQELNRLAQSGLLVE